MTIDNLIWLVIGCVIGGGIVIASIMAFCWFVWRCADEDEEIQEQERKWGRK